MTNETPKAPSRVAVLAEQLRIYHYLIREQAEETADLLACPDGACGNCQQCLTETVESLLEDRASAIHHMEGQEARAEKAEVELSALRAKVRGLDQYSTDETDIHRPGPWVKWSDLQRAVTSATLDQP